MLSCFSCVWLFVMLWTTTHQAPLSMGFSKQEYFHVSPALAGGFFTTSTTSIKYLLIFGLFVSHSLVSDSLQPRELYSQPRSSVHGILQARIPEWVIFYFFMIPSWSVWVSRNLSIFFLSCPICWCIIVHSTLIILCIPMVLVVASLLSFIILCIQVHFSFSSVSLTKDLSILFICSKTNS